MSDIPPHATTVPAEEPTEPNAEPLAPNPAEDGTVRQSFTITASYNPHLVGPDGKPFPPKFDYKPEGKDIQPEDCIALALAGAQWALAVQTKTREMMVERVKQRAKESGEKRLFVPRMGMEQ